MTAVLSKLSDELAATVEAAGAAVVQVEARRRLPASGVVWSSDGIVVTAHHVVELEDNISVGLPDGSSTPATLVGRDPTTDIAVLRTQATGLNPASLSEPDVLRVGHLVLALGRPGAAPLATLGIVSALGDAWTTSLGGRVDRYLQTDVAMYPGFSGGPLVGVDGRVGGINSSALLRGMSVTVPVPTVRRVVEALLSHGRVRRGYLGVSAQAVRLPEATARELGQETGLLLATVEPGSPAEQGGLLMGDTILSLDGEPVRNLDYLLGTLTGDRIGTEAKARILRGGRFQELQLTIGERS